MALLLQPFELSLVSYDVSGPETMKDVVFALDSLSSTIDDIFRQLDSKVAIERSRLSSINKRIAVCQSKVQAFKGSKKPATVFSSARFPGARSFPILPASCGDGDMMTQISSAYRAAEETVRYLPADSNASSIDKRELTEELHALLSRLHCHGSEIERVEVIMENKGLGPIPPSLSTVGSMLVFNSDMDPRRGYHSVDNLLSSGRGRTYEDPGPKPLKPLALAPTSLTSKAATPDIAALDLTFKPSQGVVAALALPLNLPGVPSSSSSSFSSSSSSSSVPLAATSGVLSPRQSTTITPAPTPIPTPSARSTPGIRNDGVASASGVNDSGANNSGQSNSTYPPAAPPPPPPLPPSLSSSASSSFPNTSSFADPPNAWQDKSSLATSKYEDSGGEPEQREQRARIDTSSVHNVQSRIEEQVQDQEKHGGQVGQTDGADDKPQKPSFLDAIKGMSVSNLRSASAKDLGSDSRPRPGPRAPAPVSMLDEMKERMRRRNSALTGKVDKEKKKRDSEIVSAARESNLFNMSIFPSAPSSAAPASSASLQAHSIPAARDAPSSSKKAQLPRRTQDDDSDNGSDDTCALSEVSCDDVAPRFHSTHTTHNTHTLMPSKPPTHHTQHTDNKHHTAHTGPVKNLTVTFDSSNEVQGPPIPPIPPVPPAPSPILSTNTSGLFNTSGSSALSNMLLSARQKPADNSDGSDDDHW